MTLSGRQNEPELFFCVPMISIAWKLSQNISRLSGWGVTQSGSPVVCNISCLTILHSTLHYWGLPVFRLMSTFRVWDPWELTGLWEGPSWWSSSLLLLFSLPFLLLILLLLLHSPSSSPCTPPPPHQPAPCLVTGPGLASPGVMARRG